MAQDERLKHNPNQPQKPADARDDRGADQQAKAAGIDPRTERDPGQHRQDTRAMEQHVHVDNFSPEDMERFRQAIDKGMREILPEPPILPGYHVCYLSTTNTEDTIERRMSLGYTAVKPAEAPTFRQHVLKSGDQTGYIGVREMVLFKIPTELYLRIMKINHHDRPNEEQARLASQVSMEKDSSGRQLGKAEGEGLEELKSMVVRPLFETDGKPVPRQPVI